MSITNIDSLDLGTLLQIIYSKGLYHQTSRDYSDFDMIKMHNVKVAPGKQYNFQLSTSLAPASTQRRNPGTSGRLFPRGFAINHAEYTAQFKEIQTTIEVAGNLLDRASQTVEKYAELWATQAELSLDGARRVMASEIYRDGTGALGHISSVSANDDTSVRYTFTLNNDRSTANTQSYAGWFESGDILILKERDGTASTVNITNGGQTLTYWEVVSIDVLANTVLCKGLDADFAPVVASGATKTTPPPAGEVFYRFDQQIFPDLTGTISDYGTVSTPLTGFESLAAADARTVHGMVLEGALAGSNVDGTGQSIDVSLIEQALNLAKRRVGPTRYDWKKMCTSYQTRTALIEAKETDRRFVSVTDNDRGSAEFNYIHGQTQLRLGASEFCPEDAVWMLPEVKSTGEKVMEYVGDEMKVAKYGNMADFHLKNTGSGYEDTVQQFMRGVNLLLCKHPAAIASITGFTNN